MSTTQHAQLINNQRRGKNQKRDQQADALGYIENGKLHHGQVELRKIFQRNGGNNNEYTASLYTTTNIDGTPKMPLIPYANNLNLKINRDRNFTRSGVQVVQDAYNYLPQNNLSNNGDMLLEQPNPIGEPIRVMELMTNYDDPFTIPPSLLLTIGCTDIVMETIQENNQLSKLTSTRFNTHRSEGLKTRLSQYKYACVQMFNFNPLIYNDPFVIVNKYEIADYERYINTYIKFYERTSGIHVYPTMFHKVIQPLEEQLRYDKELIPDAVIGQIVEPLEQIIQEGQFTRLDALVTLALLPNVFLNSRFADRLQVIAFTLCEHCKNPPSPVTIDTLMEDIPKEEVMQGIGFTYSMDANGNRIPNMNYMPETTTMVPFEAIVSEMFLDGKFGFATNSAYVKKDEDDDVKIVVIEPPVFYEPQKRRGRSQKYQPMKGVETPIRNAQPGDAPVSQPVEAPRRIQVPVKDSGAPVQTPQPAQPPRRVPQPAKTGGKRPHDDGDDEKSFEPAVPSGGRMIVKSRKNKGGDPQSPIIACGLDNNIWNLIPEAQPRVFVNFVNNDAVQPTQITGKKGVRVTDEMLRNSSHVAYKVNMLYQCLGIAPVQFISGQGSLFNSIDLVFLQQTLDSVGTDMNGEQFRTCFEKWIVKFSAAVQTHVRRFFTFKNTVPIKTYTTPNGIMCGGNALQQLGGDVAEVQRKQNSSKRGSDGVKKILYNPGSDVYNQMNTFSLGDAPVGSIDMDEEIKVSSDQVIPVVNDPPPIRLTPTGDPSEQALRQAYMAETEKTKKLYEAHLSNMRNEKAMKARYAALQSKYEDAKIALHKATSGVSLAPSGANVDDVPMTDANVPQSDESARTFQALLNLQADRDRLQEELNQSQLKKSELHETIKRQAANNAKQLRALKDYQATRAILNIDEGVTMVSAANHFNVMMQTAQEKQNYVIAENQRLQGVVSNNIERDNVLSKQLIEEVKASEIRMKFTKEVVDQLLQCKAYFETDKGALSQRLGGLMMFFANRLMNPEDPWDDTSLKALNDVVYTINTTGKQLKEDNERLRKTMESERNALLLDKQAAESRLKEVSDHYEKQFYIQEANLAIYNKQLQEKEARLQVLQQIEGADKGQIENLMQEASVLRTQIGAGNELVGKLVSAKQQAQNSVAALEEEVKSKETQIYNKGLEVNSLVATNTMLANAREESENSRMNRQDAAKKRSVREEEVKEEEDVVEEMPVDTLLEAQLGSDVVLGIAQTKDTNEKGDEESGKKRRMIVVKSEADLDAHQQATNTPIPDIVVEENMDQQHAFNNVNGYANNGDDDDDMDYDAPPTLVDLEYDPDEYDPTLETGLGEEELEAIRQGIYNDEYGMSTDGPQLEEIMAEDVKEEEVKETQRPKTDEEKRKLAPQDKRKFYPPEERELHRDERTFKLYYINDFFQRVYPSETEEEKRASEALVREHELIENASDPMRRAKGQMAEAREQSVLNGVQGNLTGWDANKIPSKDSDAVFEKIGGKVIDEFKDPKANPNSKKGKKGKKSKPGGPKIGAFGQELMKQREEEKKLFAKKLQIERESDPDYIAARRIADSIAADRKAEQQARRESMRTFSAESAKEKKEFMTNMRFTEDKK
jgi:hypothetical protein